MRYPVFQGSCGCQKALEKHLAGLKHNEKVNPEKVQITYDCAICQFSCGYQNGYVKHLAGKKHKEKVNKEKEKHIYESWSNLDNPEMEKVIYCCALCQVSCDSQNDLKKHLAGMKHAYKANREKYTWKASNMKK